jgi:hypothetical protein
MSDALTNETNPDVIKVYRVLAGHTVIRDYKKGTFRVRNLEFDPEFSFRRAISKKVRIDIEVGGFITANSYSHPATTDAIVTIIGNNVRLCVRIRGDAQGSNANVIRSVLYKIGAPVHCVNEIHRAYRWNYTDANREKIVDAVFADLENHIRTLDS